MPLTDRCIFNVLWRNSEIWLDSHLKRKLWQRSSLIERWGVDVKPTIPTPPPHPRLSPFLHETNAKCKQRRISPILLLPGRAEAIWRHAEAGQWAWLVGRSAPPLVQVMTGGGFPLASHCRVTGSPCRTVTSPEAGRVTTLAPTKHSVHSFGGFYRQKGGGYNKVLIGKCRRFPPKAVAHFSKHIEFTGLIKRARSIIACMLVFKIMHVERVVLKALAFNQDKS